MGRMTRLKITQIWCLLNTQNAPFYRAFKYKKKKQPSPLLAIFLSLSKDLILSLFQTPFLSHSSASNGTHEPRKRESPPTAPDHRPRWLKISSNPESPLIFQNASFLSSFFESKLSFLQNTINQPRSNP